MSIWVVSFAALVFLAVLGYFNHVARRSVKEEAVLRASQVLENTVLRMNNILEDVDLSAEYLEWLVYRHLDEPEMMMEYSRNTLQTTPSVNGVSISFEPDFFKGQHYFSAYSGYEDGEIVTMQEGSDDYQYFFLEWYLLPKLLNQPCWTEPYDDWEPDDNNGLETWMQVSYCKPLNAADGSYIGSISLDISLEWLSKTLASVKPYPNSYCILISRGGTFLVHPDPEKLFYESIFTRSLLDSDPDLVALGKAMQNQEDGIRSLTIDGQRSYVFYTPLKSTGWSMAIVCPESDIFGGFDRLHRIILGIGLLGLLLMFLICYYVISKTTKPIRSLASRAEDIASGHFDNILPALDRQDEVGTLSRSFSHMQTSLVSYIDQLTETTAKKVRIEGELQIARDIQLGMIPQVFPPFPERKEIDLYATLQSAKEVSGDLYDYFIQDDILYFCIGDVSGKGIPASLLMAVARNLFRVTRQQGLSPARIARQINESLSESNEQMMFVTMFFGAVNLRTGVLQYCNCGHNPPVLLDADGQAFFLECKPNTVIGVCPGFEFEEQTLLDLRGKALVIYTDGVNEAEDLAHVQFGNDRLLQTLQGRPDADAQSIVEGLLEAVHSHVGDAEPSDDLTVLCLKLKRS